MPSHALLIHGYSERSLASYGAFPSVLAKTAPELGKRIVLSAFNSLDDGVTIDDLAAGLEVRMQALEAQGWKTNDAVVICHSTGALVARRWILNRLGTGKPLPTHLVTMAGANHGSSLAQVGRTPLGYAHEYLSKQSIGVGALVLTDLDYGSDFLLRLNREWLERRFSPAKGDDQRLAGMYVFSMGGDALGQDKAVRLIWASSERGCDNTVRISGANLNYTYLIADPEAKVLRPLPREWEPHLIVPGKSHYGADSGILASNDSPADAPMRAIRDALDVSDKGKYVALRDAWAKANEEWESAQARNDQNDGGITGKTNADVHANSTLLFHLRDRTGRSVNDCFIGILNAGEQDIDAMRNDRPLLVDALLAMSETIEPRSPIHNNVQRGSYSFYVNTKLFNSKEHMVTITAAEIGNCVPFQKVAYTIDEANCGKLVRVNEFTYIEVVMPRDVSSSYALYGGDAPPGGQGWPPFPTEGQIA